MNDGQLKSAAIKLCALRGQDAYEMVDLPSPRVGDTILLVHCSGPRWKLAVLEIKNEIERRQNALLIDLVCKEQGFDVEKRK